MQGGNKMLQPGVQNESKWEFGPQFSKPKYRRLDCRGNLILLSLE